MLGEDIGKAGGVFRATEGLRDEFGEERVLDTPLAENGIVGTAVGMALYGLRPIAEIQFSDFIYPGFDQILSETAKFRYRSAGQYTSPIVVRAPVGRRHQGRALSLAVARRPVRPHRRPQGGRPPRRRRDAKGLLLAAHLRSPIR